MVNKTLRLVRDMIDGELYEYEDGWVLTTTTVGYKITFTYSLDGELEKTEVKKF